MLHRARADVCARALKFRTNIHTDTQTHTQTEIFFDSSCDKGLRRRFAAQTRTARVFRSLRRGPVPAPVRGSEGGQSGR